MRLTAIAFTVTLLAGVSASAQAPGQLPPPTPHPYGLDPYNPSDAALLRDYGATLVAQTPLVELAKLDRFKPSDAALLRQLGGGIPIWGWLWHPSAPTPFQSPYGTAVPAVDAAAPVSGSTAAIGAAPNDKLPPARLQQDQLHKLDPSPRLGPERAPRSLEARVVAE